MPVLSANQNPQEQLASIVRSVVEALRSVAESKSLDDSFMSVYDNVAAHVIDRVEAQDVPASLEWIVVEASPRASTPSTIQGSKLLSEKTTEADSVGPSSSFEGEFQADFPSASSDKSS
jgi:hypothetical protein